MESGTTIGSAYVQILPSAEGISGKLSNVLSGEAASAGTSAGETIGKKIGAAITKTIAVLGIGKMISSAISSGMDFEESMTKASTLFSGTSEELEELEKRILGVSSSTGMAASELAEAAYSAESASVPVQNLGDMIEASAKLATAGFTDVDTALSATAKTMNAYGMMSDDAAETQKNLEKVQRILIQTQNKGITTVGELGASLAQVTPTAASFGVSFDQVGASLAGMTAQGTPTAQATTQLNSLIAELGKNGTTAAKNLTEAAKGTRYAGMSFTQMMENGLDLNDVLSMMQGLADKNNLSMVDMFSSIEAGKAALAITNSDWLGNMEAMAAEADVVGDAYDKMGETVSFKLNQVKTAIKNLGIQAFSASADTLTKALSGVSTVLEIIHPSLELLGGSFKALFSAVVSGTKEMLGLDESFSASETIAAALKTAIEWLAEKVQYLADNMETIGPIIKGAIELFIALKAAMAISSIVSGLGGAIGLLASPVGIAVAAIGGLIAIGAVLVKHWDELKEGAANLKEKISTKWNELKESTGKTFSAIKETAAKEWEDLKSKTSTVWNNIKTDVSGAWENIKETVSSKADSLKTAVSDKWEAIKESVSTKTESMKTTLSNTWDTMKQNYETHGTSLEGIATATYENIKLAITTEYDLLNTITDGKLGSILGTFSTVFNSIYSTVSGIFGNIYSSISSYFTNIFSSVSGTASYIYSSVSGTFSSMYSTISGTFSNMWSTISGTFNNIWSSISGTMSSIGSTISSSLSWISGLFSGIHISFPHISLPHFDVWWQDLGLVSIPHISISWYRKAYDQPYMFTEPTVMGFGDGNGGEMVYGHENLMNDIREAVGDTPVNVTINVYPQKGQSEEQIAQEVQKVLVRWDKQRKAAAFA